MRLAGLPVLLLGQFLALSRAIALKSAPASIRSDSDADSDIITREGEGEGESEGEGEAEGEAGAEEHVVRTGTSMDLDMTTDLDAQAEVALEADAMKEVSVTLSPKQRAAEKWWRYTDDFWVEINMTRARETGMALGMVVTADEDWKPVKVTRVKKNGLVEEWNRAHPEQHIQVEDEILQVNAIQYHHNASAFQERIGGQVHAARKGVPGAKEMLTLHIMRPRQDTRKRSQYQREDVHRKLYAAEFTAKIPVPSSGLPVSEDPDRDMGWLLKFTKDWNPMTIAQIVPGGLLDRWNVAHPDSVILAGDEIMGVNAVFWHHNSTIFLTRIRQQFLAARRNPQLNNTLSLSIRRPRPVQEAYDKDKVPEAAADALKATGSGAKADPFAGAEATGPGFLGPEAEAKQKDDSDDEGWVGAED